MSNHKLKIEEVVALDKGNAWVLSTKSVGGRVANWKVVELYRTNSRILQANERCELTSFCYPIGAKVVRARLKEIE